MVVCLLYVCRGRLCVLSAGRDRETEHVKEGKRRTQREEGAGKEEEMMQVEGVQ